MRVSWCGCPQIPGRAGDAAVAGGAAYADGEAGGCGSTGDGDLHLVFMPCYQVSAAGRCCHSRSAFHTLVATQSHTEGIRQWKGPYPDVLLTNALSHHHP